VSAPSRAVHPVAGPCRAHRGERGIVLALVLILALLLSAAVSTFIRRAVIDNTIIQNRDAVAQAEALARGGIRIGSAILIANHGGKAVTAISGRGSSLGRGREEAPDEVLPGNSLLDIWAQLETVELISPDGGRVTIRVTDTGSKLNLNAIIPRGVAKQAANEEAAASQEQALAAQQGQSENDAEDFLIHLFEKIIDEMQIPPGERNYDPRELAQNFIDYVDEDDERVRGGPEDEYYLAQDPPYQAANRPLLSFDEIGLIEGFDGDLVKALRPYATVYPLYAAEGVNLNTAPAHVLATVYHGSSGDRRLINEEVVSQILKVREEENLLCAGGGGVSGGDEGQTKQRSSRCRNLRSVGLERPIFPSIGALPSQSLTYEIHSEAIVKDIRRRVEAIVTLRPGEAPQLLSWQLR